MRSSEHTERQARQANVSRTTIIREITNARIVYEVVRETPSKTSCFAGHPASNSKAIDGSNAREAKPAANGGQAGERIATLRLLIP